MEIAICTFNYFHPKKHSRRFISAMNKEKCTALIVYTILYSLLVAWLSVQGVLALTNWDTTNQKQTTDRLRRSELPSDQFVEAQQKAPKVVLYSTVLPAEIVTPWASTSFYKFISGSLATNVILVHYMFSLFYNTLGLATLHQYAVRGEAGLTALSNK